MTYACNVPINGSEAGKNSFAKTSPVTVLYSRKSYHSIVVPIVLAINARRSCPRCSEADKDGLAVRSIATLRSSLRRLLRRPILPPVLQHTAGSVHRAGGGQSP